MPSYRLKNLSIMPPGGWQFTQPEIKWTAPQPLNESPRVLASRVRQLRLNNLVLARLNLPTDVAVIEAEIIAYNCLRHPGICVEVGAGSATATATVTRKGGCCGR